MAKRITIMIDELIDKKLRLIQAKQISKTISSVSYSCDKRSIAKTVKIEFFNSHPSQKIISNSQLRFKSVEV